MPNLTVTHEAPLELIKQHPALAVDLLRGVTGLAFSEGAGREACLDQPKQGYTD